MTYSTHKKYISTKFHASHLTGARGEKQIVRRGLEPTVPMQVTSQFILNWARLPTRLEAKKNRYSTNRAFWQLSKWRMARHVALKVCAAISNKENEIIG